jgi:rubrerythrin
MVAGFLINQVKLSSSVTAMSIACMAPLAVLLLLGLYIIWRCPACDETLGRDDPQFCPGCGVQLR